MKDVFVAGGIGLVALALLMKMKKKDCGCKKDQSSGQNGSSGSKSPAKVLLRPEIVPDIVKEQFDASDRAIFPTYPGPYRNDPCGNFSCNGLPLG